MAKPISTTIRVNDRASSTLQTISKNLGKCISGFMRLNQVSSNAINVGSMTNCENILNNINSNVERIAQSMGNASNASDGLESSISNAERSSNNLLRTLKRVAGAYFTLQAGRNVIDTSDMLAQAKQRISLTMREGENIDEINKKIMASANSARASYADTLNQVSKLAMNAGQSFESTDQITKFVEQFNKLGAMSGASVYESSQAMYQLTQSMAKGKLDGDELRSVLEGMPLVAREIAEYMSTDLELLEKLGKTEIDVGTMKALAAEGMVTAEVVRNALLGSAKETDEMFKTMPVTWSQTWQLFKNNAIQAFSPIFERINAIANNPQMQEFINDLVGGMYAISNATMFVFDILGGLFGFIYENWSILAPIMFSVLTIMGLYTGAIVAQNAVMAISNGLKTIAAIRSVVAGTATAAEAAATVGMTTAQMSLNAALYACPLTWIIILIIALIAIIYAVVAAINKVTGSTISATGVIIGAIATAGAAIWNIISGVVNFIIGIGVELYNLIATFANFFGNVFYNPCNAIIRLFGGVLDFIVGVVQSAAGLIDTLLGSDLSSAVAGFRSNVADHVTKVIGEEKIVMEKVSQEEVLAKIGMDRIGYGDAFDTGYKFGEGIDNKIGDMFKMEDLSKYEIGNFEVPNYEEINNSLGNIDDNTGNMAKSVDISQEDLKYLRDIAEQEAINRFTTAEIKVDMKNNNNISSNMDLDGVVDHLATRISETMGAVAAGAY